MGATWLLFLLIRIYSVVKLLLSPSGGEEASGDNSPSGSELGRPMHGAETPHHKELFDRRTFHLLNRFLTAVSVQETT